MHKFILLANIASRLATELYCCKCCCFISKSIYKVFQFKYYFVYFKNSNTKKKRFKAILINSCAIYSRTDQPFC